MRASLARVQPLGEDGCKLATVKEPGLEQTVMSIPTPRAKRKGWRMNRSL